MNFLNKKDFRWDFQLGRMTFTLLNRNSDEGEYLFDYVSWCYPSETFYFGKFELNIQNRRNPAKMYD